MFGPHDGRRVTVHPYRRMMPFLDAKEVLPGLRGAQASGTAGNGAKAEKAPLAGAGAKA